MEGLRELVAAVFRARDKFFSDHSVEDKPQRAPLVQQCIDRAVAAADVLLEQDAQDPEVIFLKGKALNATPSHSAEAEELLARAVKLKPSLVEAWDALGECFWKRGDLASSQACFNGALKHKKTKESLRHLSMLLRQTGGTPAEQQANIEDSLQKAKEAVALDLNDGHSWYIMGNAHLALFFRQLHNVEHLRQALKAFKRASTDADENANNPDLHQNCATLLKFQEDYVGALESLAKAAQLDDDPTSALDQMSAIRRQIRNVGHAIQTKAKLKAKRVAGMATELQQERQGKDLTLAQLSDGENAPTAGPLLARVAAVLTAEPVPQVLVAMDTNGAWFCITVYNLQANVISAGDTLRITAPQLSTVHLVHQDEETRYASVRVDNPQNIVRNGQPVAERNLARTMLGVTAKAN